MVETEHGEIIECFLGTESACQVKGVECPDRLHGKRPARAGDSTSASSEVRICVASASVLRTPSLPASPSSHDTTARDSA
jgi:hypothetical protein